jgi:hypothetical protein
MAEPDLTIVRFVKKYPPYNVDDRAGFNFEFAKTLVAQEFATFSEEEPKVHEPMEIGGSWYSLGIEKVQGEEAAWDRYRELIGEEEPSEDESESAEGDEE